MSLTMYATALILTLGAGLTPPTAGFLSNSPVTVTGTAHHDCADCFYRTGIPSSIGGVCQVNHHVATASGTALRYSDPRPHRKRSCRPLLLSSRTVDVDVIDVIDVTEEESRRQKEQVIHCCKDQLQIPCISPSRIIHHLPCASTQVCWSEIWPLLSLSPSILAHGIQNFLRSGYLEDLSCV